MPDELAPAREQPMLEARDDDAARDRIDDVDLVAARVAPPR